MLTRRRFIPPTLTGDWTADGPRLLKAISDYLLSLEQKGALAITEAEISGTVGVGNFDLNGNDLVIDADGDTYIHETADDVVRMVVAGSDHTIWNTTGLGVGTVPSYRLHASGSSNVFLVDGYGTTATAPGTLFRKAEGTPAAPSAVSVNSFLGGILCAGYTSSGAFGANNVGAIAIKAAEAFTATNQGTYISFDTTATGATSRAERMRIDASGNVGIGVTPSYKLHVLNNASVSAYGFVLDSYEGATFKNSFIAGWSVASDFSYLFNFQNFPMVLGVNNAEVMRITTTGVGIGVTPSAKLHAAGPNIAVGQNDALIQFRTTTAQAADVGASIQLGGMYDGSNALGFAEIAGRKENSTSGNWSGYLQFATRQYGGSFAERMRIPSSGDRLIFTSAFHVTSATATGTTPALQSGTYTPTLSNTTNITSSTANADAKWFRVGNIVHVSCPVSVRPAGAGSCVLGVSLPIASNLAASTELSGVGVWSTTIVGSVTGDTTNDRATFTFTATVDPGIEAPTKIEFSYEVL